MVKRNILGRDPQQELGLILKQMRDAARQNNTTPTGIKDFGDTGDAIWERPDGTVVSVREVDSDLQAAQERIDQAAADLVIAKDELEKAMNEAAAAQERLDTLDETTLPEIRAEVEEKAAEAARELGQLDTKLGQAQTDLATAQQNLTDLTADLGAEQDAREALAGEMARSFTELDDRLDSFATDEAMASLRTDLAAAQQAATDAKAVASTANTAANAASQAALEAAGIAASKGRVIIQQAEPQGDDRNAANIWIQPIDDDPATEAEEKAVTYVYLEASDEWVRTTSDEIAQAAQNALDAREAAQQAQQRADTAIANAAAAQTAAEAAQRTADQATLDAADAHNAAVDAADAATAIRNDLANGPSVWEDSSFERGSSVLAPITNNAQINRTDEWAATGDYSIKYEANGSGGNVFGTYLFVPAQAGRWYSVSATIHAGDAEQRWNTTWDARTTDTNTGSDLVGYLITGDTGYVTVAAGETKTQTWFFQVPEGAKFLRFWTGLHSSYNGSANTGQKVYLDDFRLVDVTESYPQYLAAQKAAEDAQKAADAAYAEAAAKATPAEVKTAADAAEAAAKTAAAADAKAKADQAKADALAGAATDAKSKADAAQAAAVAAASADAKTKADKALADALDALTKARGEISTEIINSANGKNSVTVSGSAPSGSGVVNGDVWWRIDGSSNVYGQWVWNGSQWVARTIRSEVIANLDVNKLVVSGSATMAQAVIDKIWADGISAKYLEAQRVTVAPGNIFPDPYFKDAAMWPTNLGASISPDSGAPNGTRLTLTYSTVSQGTYYGTPTYRGIVLEPGATYRLRAFMRFGGASAPPSIAFYVRGERADGTTPYAEGTTIRRTVAYAWAWHEAIVTVPADFNGPCTVGFYSTTTNNSGGAVYIGGVELTKRVGAVSIENGAVNADKVNAQSVAGAVGNFIEANVSKLVADSSTTKEAVINKLWADGIATKAITAARVTVAPGSIFPDPYFQDKAAWAGTGLSIVEETAGVPTSSYFHIAGTTAQRGTYFGATGKYVVPVEPGATYRVRVQVRTSGTEAKNFQLSARVQTATGFSSASIPLQAPATAAGTWSWVEGTLTIPATATGGADMGLHTLAVYTNVDMDFRGVEIVKKVGAVLIEDGAITTPKLNVTDSMAAAIVQAMNVETKKLVVTEETILANKTYISNLIVGDINATGKLIGTDGVFTGTVDFANVNVTGQQIVNMLAANSIDASKINGNSFSGNTFTGGTFNGAAFLGGSYATSSHPATKGGVMIDPVNGIRGWSSSGTQTFSLSTTTGRVNIAAPLEATDAASGSGIVIDPQTSAAKATIHFALNGDTSGNSAAIWRTGYTNSRDPLRLRGANGSGVVIENGLDVASPGNLEADGGYIGGVAFNSSNKNTSIIKGKFFYPNRTTVSASANTFMSSSDEFAKITSSRRFKRNIIDWNPTPESVLALQPRQWQHDDPANTDWIDERWHVGFVAEEVEAVGLRDLVVYNLDEKGSWVPEALSYDRFCAAQQVVLKKHEDEIAVLMARISELEAKVV